MNFSTVWRSGACFDIIVCEIFILSEYRDYKIAFHLYFYGTKIYFSSSTIWKIKLFIKYVSRFILTSYSTNLALNSGAYSIHTYIYLWKNVYFRKVITTGSNSTYRYTDSTPRRYSYLYTWINHTPQPLKKISSPPKQQQQNNSIPYLSYANPHNPLQYILLYTRPDQLPNQPSPTFYLKPRLHVHTTPPSCKPHQKTIVLPPPPPPPSSCT